MHNLPAVPIILMREKKGWPKFIISKPLYLADFMVVPNICVPSNDHICLVAGAKLFRKYACKRCYYGTKGK
jgi:hypothetical protein